MTRFPYSPALFAATLSLAAAPVAAQTGDDSLYRHQPGANTRWASPENPTGVKGAGGRENKGGKGRAFETIPAGGEHVLADVKGAGVIDRFWITVNDRTPEMLRALRLEIYWDGARTPAVSVPLGDMFLGGAGELKPMETAMVASPEGRSFVSYIPMPFRTGARMVVRNDSAKPLALIFYDVNYRVLPNQPADALYFHAYWSRQRATPLGEDFRVMPRVTGRGRFLGTAVTVFTHPSYGKTWWGEGEAKIYLDGDRALPTLVGTGTEDYIGTAWGQGAYVNRFQGAPVSDEAQGRWNFYRFHIPDPIFFDREAEVRLQQIGGSRKADVIRMQREGAKLQPVTVDPGNRPSFVQLLNGPKPIPLTDPKLPDGWTNFYRSDDVSAVAFFYLDKPVSGLPALAPVAERTAALRPPKDAKDSSPLADN